MDLCVCVCVCIFLCLPVSCEDKPHYVHDNFVSVCRCSRYSPVSCKDKLHNTYDTVYVSCNTVLAGGWLGFQREARIGFVAKELLVTPLFSDFPFPPCPFL